MSLETKAAGVAGASVAGVSLSLDLLGVPVSVVLAALLGAGGILSFLPPMPLGRMVGTVVFCTSAAVYGGPLVVRYFSWLAGGELLAALGLAAILQLTLPWVIENRTRLIERFFPGKKGGDA